MSTMKPKTRCTAGKNYHTVILVDDSDSFHYLVFKLNKIFYYLTILLVCKVELN